MTEPTCPLCGEPITRYDAAGYDNDGSFTHDVCGRKAGREDVAKVLAEYRQRETRNGCKRTVRRVK